MPDPTALRLCRYAPHGVMAPHRHEVPVLRIVIDGNFTEHIGRCERHYSRGTATLCPAGVVHSQEFGAAGARAILAVPQAAWLEYLADCKIELAALPYAHSPAFQSLGGRLLAELASGDAFSALAREGLLLETVAALARNGSVAPVAPAPPAWLRRAREFIHDNAAQPLTLARIAQAAGRHEIHLAREFRRHFGRSVGGYLRHLRTENAARLLMQSQHRDITEIAYACGFSSHSHLCREFKAHFGTTPSQYRDRQS